MRLSFALAALLMLVSSPSLADGRYTVGALLPATAADELASRQFKDLLSHELIERFTDPANQARCPVAMVDSSQTISDAREVEQRLQDEGYTDAQHAVEIEPLQWDNTIEGVVGRSTGDIDYILEIVDRDGKSVAKMEGSLRESEWTDKIGQVAADMFDKICPRRAFRVAGGKADLQFDQPVCDITKPFTLNAKGKMAGIRLDLSPSGEAGGSFKVGGSAASLPWSGGGSYTLTRSTAGGSLAMNGSWTVHSPVGSFSNNGSIPATLTPLATCDPAAKPTSPAAQSKPAAKKKR